MIENGSKPSLPITRAVVRALTCVWRSSLAAAPVAETLAVSPMLLLSRERTSKNSGSKSSRASPKLLCDKSSLAVEIGRDVYCRLSALLAGPAGQSYISVQCSTSVAQLF